MNNLRFFCGLIMAVLVLSCGSFYNPELQDAKPDKSVLLKVIMPEPNRLRFSGKGAGAGMMLMSSMGPMGMAVGVAIDEGIGKDIAVSLSAEGFDFERELQQALQKGMSKSGYAGKSKSLTVAVERYGFKTYGRAEYSDPISPELKMKVILPGQKEIVVDYPAKFEGDLPLVPLEEAKVNGEISLDAMRKALTLIATRVNQVLS